MTHASYKFHGAHRYIVGYARVTRKDSRLYLGYFLLLPLYDVFATSEIFFFSRSYIFHARGTKVNKREQTGKQVRRKSEKKRFSLISNYFYKIKYFFLNVNKWI